jgi:hypothetical protein
MARELFEPRICARVHISGRSYRESFLSDGKLYFTHSPFEALRESGNQRGKCGRFTMTRRDNTVLASLSGVPEIVDAGSGGSADLRAIDGHSGIYLRPIAANGAKECNLCRDSRDRIEARSLT